MKRKLSIAVFLIALLLAVYSGISWHLLRGAGAYRLGTMIGTILSVSWSFTALAAFLLLLIFSITTLHALKQRKKELATDTTTTSEMKTQGKNKENGKIPVAKAVPAAANDATLPLPQEPAADNATPLLPQDPATDNATLLLPQDPTTDNATLLLPQDPAADNATLLLPQDPAADNATLLLPQDPAADNATLLLPQDPAADNATLLLSQDSAADNTTVPLKESELVSAAQETVLLPQEPDTPLCCPRCGAVRKPNQRFCTKCGNALEGGPL